MLDDNIQSLPATTTYTVEQALQYALQNSTLGCVLIVGEFPDGRLFVVSSRMKRADANWLADRAKFHALGNAITK